MEPIAIAGLLILIVVTGGCWFHTRYSRRLEPLLERQAAKRGGRVMSSGWFSLPQLLITVAGVELRISAMAGSISARKSREMTFADIAVSENVWPLLSLRERGTKLVNSIADVLPKGRDILMGNSRFDMRFRVCGQNQTRIKAFLGNDAIALRLLDLPTGVELDCGERRCVLSIDGVAKADHTVDLLIDAAAEIARWVVHPTLSQSSPTDPQP